MDKMFYWNQCDLPPKEALKTISGGRMNGKTDINPQWRVKKLTEMFGVCGFGWYYDIDRLWIEDGANGEKLAFAKVNLFILNNKADINEWSKPIQGTGGHVMVVSESKGLRSNDECFKMAITDALSVCCKMLGIASRVYEGTHADSKYDRKEEIIYGDASAFKKAINETKSLEDLKVIGGSIKLAKLQSVDIQSLQVIYAEKQKELQAV